MAEKMAYLKSVNANGDFADFNQQMVEECMFFFTDISHF